MVAHYFYKKVEMAIMDDFDYDVLESIDNKLKHISDILEKLLYEQQKANLAFENVGEEISFKKEFVCSDLKEVDNTLLNYNTTLFLGFEKKKVKELVNRFAVSIGSSVKYVPFLETSSEFASYITSCQENDILLLNCAGITKSQKIYSIITDAISDGQISITCGKGISANNFLLDIPKVYFVFVESTYYYVPKILRDEIDFCIWNENDRKKVW